MTKYIVLLRGINVGGKNKMKMQELKTLLETLDCQNIKTYIQSGNILLESLEKLPKQLALKIKKSIKLKYNYDVTVLVLPAQYILETVQNNPFLNKEPSLDIKYLHVTFLASLPPNDLVQKLNKLNTGTEQLKVVKDKIYLYYPDGYGRAKMTHNKLERQLQVSATTRNWRTCLKLAGMIEN